MNYIDFVKNLFLLVNDATLQKISNIDTSQIKHRYTPHNLKKMLVKFTEVLAKKDQSKLQTYCTWSKDVEAVIHCIQSEVDQGVGELNPVLDELLVIEAYRFLGVLHGVVELYRVEDFLCAIEDKFDKHPFKLLKDPETTSGKAMQEYIHNQKFRIYGGYAGEYIEFTRLDIYNLMRA